MILLKRILNGSLLPLDFSVVRGSEMNISIDKWLKSSYEYQKN
jgi:hypothetical protein